MSLNKINLLSNDILIKEIQKFGRKSVKHPFVIYSLKNNLDTFRLCIRISKKVGKANKRNKLKRYIKETFRKMDPKNTDFVVISSKRIEVVDFSSITSILNECLRQN
ncbi:MAG: ribonuclease P protein component [Planctomycetes bacterium]|nr:ribonuclease P protein component [Planctomycetota bacterium]